MHVSRMMGIDPKHQTVDTLSAVIGVGVVAKYNGRLRITSPEVMGRNPVPVTKYGVLAVIVILHNNTGGNLHISMRHARVN